MPNKISEIQKALSNGMSYEAYRTLTTQLVETKSTTGEITEEKINFTKLNHSRMKRLDKTIVLSDDIIQTIKNITEPQNWIVISEPWCGDAAQNLPLLNAVAKRSENIHLEIVLRDEHESLMNEFLTNGGKSIPKMIMYSTNKKEIIGTWGPRPAFAQNMLKEYKAAPAPKMSMEEFKKDLQIWYNNDKTMSLQKEFVEMLS